MTALHYAALMDGTELVDLLIKHDADPNLRDEAGYLPVDYSDSAHTQRRLREYMATHAARKERIERARAEEEAEEKRRQRRAFPLEQRLHQYIVGQDGPIMAVAAAVRGRDESS